MVKIGGNTDLKSIREKLEIINETTILDLTEALVDMFEQFIIMNMQLNDLIEEVEYIKQELENVKNLEV